MSDLEAIIDARASLAVALKKVTAQFEVRRNLGQTALSPLPTARSSWHTVSVTLPTNLRAGIERHFASEEAAAARVASPRYPELKLSKNCLRRALHVIDSVLPESPPTDLVPATRIATHYQPRGDDLVAVGLGAAWKGSEQLSPLAIEALTRMVPGLTFSRSDGSSSQLTVREAALAIAAVLPAAGPRVAAYVAAATLLQSKSTGGGCGADSPATLVATQETATALESRLAAEARSATTCQLVAPGLYLGSHVSATDAALLAGLGVSAAVNCTGYDLPYPPCVTAVHRLAVDQSSYARGPLERAVAALRGWIGEGRTVLVHCVEGRFRSATLVAAYLMAVAGTALSAEEAAARVREARPWARPKGFVLRALAHDGWPARGCVADAARAGSEAAE